MKKNVLVFPCGSEIGLEIHSALKFVKDITLFGGSSVPDHGKFVYKNYIGDIPSFNEPEFISRINDIIEENKIDFIFPAHDSVVLKLAENQADLKAEVITSPAETCQICRSKIKTYHYFAEDDFTPRIFDNPSEVDQYPVFLKPDVGQGSKGIAVAKNNQELDHILESNEAYVISELLPGKEYTIDCFSDRKGNIKFVGMRERRRIKTGISVNSVSLEAKPEVKAIAEKINKKLKLRGVWFFQVKEDVNGDYKLLEIAPRIAGSMSVHRNKGINFALLSIFDRLNFDIDVIANEYSVEIDRALTNRFNLNIDYDKVYIDFDDTVTKTEAVNPFVMMFLYQCINKKKEIVLITKHIHNITETLDKLKIDKNIFDQIVHLKKEDEKYKYFERAESSIFIDDSFSERRAIKDQFGIPVFDIDSIESLIDWRM